MAQKTLQQIQNTILDFAKKTFEEEGFNTTKQDVVPNTLTEGFWAIDHQPEPVLMGVSVCIVEDKDDIKNIKEVCFQ